MRFRGRPTPEPFEGCLYDRPVPGLEGLASQSGPKAAGWSAGQEFAATARGRRAPAIPMPVDAPPKSKRGRRA